MLPEGLFHHFLLEFLRQPHVFGHVAFGQCLLHRGLHLRDMALHGGGHLLHLRRGGRISGAAALVGGMLFATLLGIFVYPALYYFVGKIGRFEQRRELKKQEENA